MDSHLLLNMTITCNIYNRVWSSYNCLRINSKRLKRIIKSKKNGLIDSIKMSSLVAYTDKILRKIKDLVC